MRARLSLPTSRRRRRIERVGLFRYAGPAARRRDLDPPYGIVLRLRVGDVTGGDPKVTLALIPANVEGDGRTPVADLLDRKATERNRHPYLRYHPGTAARVRDRVDTDTVLAEGVRLFTGRSPYLSAGADTIGYPACPVPALADLASRVREALGGPPVLAVTFAARPPDNRSSRPYWAVSEVDPDPVLAQFAWPWRGYVTGAALYDAIARELQRGQRYEFARS